MNYLNFSELEDRLLNKNDDITFEEALELTDTPKDKLLELTTLARKVTLKNKGDGHLRILSEKGVTGIHLCGEED